MLSSLNMLDSEMVSGVLIAAISKRAALSVMAHMTPRPSSTHTSAHTHTVAGNLSEGIVALVR